MLVPPQVCACLYSLHLYPPVSLFNAFVFASDMLGAFLSVNEGHIYLGSIQLKVTKKHILNLENLKTKKGQIIHLNKT